MADIIVTTPKRKMKQAAQEAEEAKREWENGEGRSFYFRKLGKHLPTVVGVGSRVYYIEDGYVRGFCTITHDDDIVWETREGYGEGWFVHLWADEWKWIVPISLTGFQGWRYSDRYFSRGDVQVVGDWLDPRPGTKYA